jgi:hypothetical protein
MNKKEPVVVLDSHYDDAEARFSETTPIEYYIEPQRLNSAQLRDLAQRHTEAAITTLAGVMNDPRTSAAAKVAAASTILDRGWGKPGVEGHIGGDRPPISEIKVLFGTVATPPSLESPKKTDKKPAKDDDAEH